MASFNPAGNPPPYGAQSQYWGLFPASAPIQEETVAYPYLEPSASSPFIPTKRADISPEVSRDILSDKINSVKDAVSLVRKETPLKSSSSYRPSRVTLVDNSTHFSSTTFISSGSSRGRDREDSDQAARVAVGLVATGVVLLGSWLLGGKVKALQESGRGLSAAKDLEKELEKDHDVEVVRELKAREIARKGTELFSTQRTNAIWSTAAVITIIASAALALVGAVTASWALIGLGILGTVAGTAISLFRWSYTSGDEAKIQRLANEILTQ